jgi:hypothetical protein
MCTYHVMVFYISAILLNLLHLMIHQFLSTFTFTALFITSFAFRISHAQLKASVSIDTRGEPLLMVNTSS